MAASSARRRRDRGAIETLPSGSLRVKVYAGIDPISGKRHYLTDVIPPGMDAEKARTRMVAEVADRRTPRTRATKAVGAADRACATLDAEAGRAKLRGRRGPPKAVDQGSRPARP